MVLFMIISNLNYSKCKELIRLSSWITMMTQQWATVFVSQLYKHLCRYLSTVMLIIPCDRANIFLGPVRYERMFSRWSVPISTWILKAADFFGPKLVSPEIIEIDVSPFIETMEEPSRRDRHESEELNFLHMSSRHSFAWNMKITSFPHSNSQFIYHFVLSFVCLFYSLSVTTFLLFFFRPCRPIENSV